MEAVVGAAFGSDGLSSLQHVLTTRLLPALERLHCSALVSPLLHLVMTTLVECTPSSTPLPRTPHGVARGRMAVEQLLDLAEQKLYETHWKAVPIGWRQLYTLSAALLAILELAQTGHSSLPPANSAASLPAEAVAAATSTVGRPQNRGLAQDSAMCVDTPALEQPTPTLLDPDARRVDGGSWDQHDPAAADGGPGWPVHVAIRALGHVDKGLLMGAPLEGVKLTELASLLHQSIPGGEHPSSPIRPLYEGLDSSDPRDTDDVDVGPEVHFNPHHHTPTDSGSLSAPLNAANPSPSEVQGAEAHGEGEACEAGGQDQRKRRRIYTPITTIPLPSTECPSLVTFLEQYLTPATPVVLTGAIAHWPALDRWADPEYLLTIAGRRVVPVEVGGDYTRDEWSQQLMPLRTLVRRFGEVIEEEEEPAAVTSDQSCEVSGPDLDKNRGAQVYLAQHDLFSQIPELGADIETPDYCCLAGDDDGPAVNAWFGPSGTVTPLHHDPYHNLLCQVVGRKRVWLYRPGDSAAMYPYTEELLFNTSQVDAEAPDLDRYPDFAQATRFECELGPGDTLYIPPGWWHHVRSLSVSFSVSHWFGP